MTNRNVYVVVFADNTIVFVNNKEEAEKYKRKEKYE